MCSRLTMRSLVIVRDNFWCFFSRCGPKLNQSGWSQLHTCVVKRGLTKRFNIRYMKREKELDLVFMPCCLHDTFIKLDKYLGALSFITLYTRFNFNCFTRRWIGNIFTSLNSLEPMCVLAGAFIRNRSTLLWVHCSLYVYICLNLRTTMNKHSQNDIVLRLR